MINLLKLTVLTDQRKRKKKKKITMELLLLLLSTVVFFTTIFIFFVNPETKSKFPPCPQSYPVIGNLPGFLRNRHRFHDWVADMIAGTPTSTLRVRTFFGISDGVCTADPDNIRHLLSTNFPNYIKGSRFHAVLHDLIGDGIFNADGHLWSVQRKIASREFTTKSLKRFISDMVASEISDRLLPCLRRLADEERVVDLHHILTRFTFDNVCKLAFGVDPCCLSLDTDTESPNSSFVRAFEFAVEISSSRFMSPIPIIWKTKRFLNLGSEKRFREAVAEIDRFAEEIINSKLINQNRDPNSTDLLSRFISLDEELGFGDLKEKKKFLRDIVTSFVLAGRDTTATALTWFFWIISGHPRCAQSILTELSSSAPEEKLSYDELKNMNYLHAAISESMRLFPPLPIDSRMALNDDVLPDGTRVEKGWFADYSAYAVGRMERVWGPDCRDFKPERWLTLSDHDVIKFQPSDPFRFPVFHCGPRICLGKEMAYVQMKSIAAAVLSNFEIAAMDGGGTPGRVVEPPYVLSLLLKMKGGFNVRLKRRKLDNHVSEK